MRAIIMKVTRSLRQKICKRAEIVLFLLCKNHSFGNAIHELFFMTLWKMYDINKGVSANIYYLHDKVIIEKVAYIQVDL